MQLTFNQVEFTGRMVHDPEMKILPSGKSVLKFVVACNRDLPKGSDAAQTADFIRCETWEKTAEMLTKYGKKGIPVLITGRLQTRSFEKDGKRQTDMVVLVNRIHFLDTTPRKVTGEDFSAPSEFAIATPEDMPF